MATDSGQYRSANNARQRAAHQRMTKSAKTAKQRRLQQRRGTTTI